MSGFSRTVKQINSASGRGLLRRSAKAPPRASVRGGDPAKPEMTLYDHGFNSGRIRPLPSASRIRTSGLCREAHEGLPALWTTDAADDLERICDDIAETNPDSARRIASTIVEGVAADVVMIE